MAQNIALFSRHPSKTKLTKTNLHPGSRQLASPSVSHGSSPCRESTGPVHQVRLLIFPLVFKPRGQTKKAVFVVCKHQESIQAMIIKYIPERLKFIHLKMIEVLG